MIRALTPPPQGFLQFTSFSIKATLNPFFAKISAHLEPEGPAPEITTSYSFFPPFCFFYILIIYYS